ncbi:MAG TPA: 16S rRNA (uracil(1498)-N(3))-methyltransferase [Vicinamibacterales bacterium]|nr:16S rRNA (uracil(1498)-N(3))-methyltransferase [Vicinamibacterales bacterium]
MSVPRVFAPDAASLPSLQLSDDEAHHLRHVLRARAGDPLVLFDGRGGEWDARVAAIDRRHVEVARGAARTPTAEPAVRVTLALGVLKGDQMDTAIRDATTLGAAAIQPIASAHTAVPERAWRAPAAVARWRRVAIASAKQCGRAVVPPVEPVATFADVLARDDDDARLICVEPAAAVHAGADPFQSRPRSAIVFIGPEGGWSPAELAAAAARGSRPVALGPRRLRAETVPTALLSVLWTRWGWQ